MMARVVLVDNYDSFTFNLVQQLGSLGAHVQVVRNDELSVEDLEAAHPSAIVLSPGPGTPEAAGITLAAVERLSGRVPILGVCLGHQAIAQAFGGRVVRAAEPLHGVAQPLRHSAQGPFEGLPQGFLVARYNSLVVDPTTLASELEVAAWSPSGEVMALRHRAAPLWGLQFHPESFLSERGDELMGNWLRMLPLH